MTSKITKSSPVSVLGGCGKKRAEQLAQLGIETVGDLLRHFPRAYQDRGRIRHVCDEEVGNTGAFVMTVSAPPHTVRISGGRTMTKCRAFDGERQCTLIFFNRNYVKDMLYTGVTYRFWGKLGRSKYGYDMSPSVIEPIDGVKPLFDLVPLYPLTKGITHNFLKTLITSAISLVQLDEESETLPKQVREKLGVCSEAQALRAIHDPQNEKMIEVGRQRFILEELFLFACSVTLAKRGRTSSGSKRLLAEKCKLYEFTAALPFKLTAAQSRVISEIRKDMISDHPMARLVSGDVGSGKTVCAMAAAYMAIKNGYQCAMMAPTEILAMQHYRDFTELFARLGIECGYLTGATPAATKRKTLEKLASGELKMIVGTHALLSDKVVFADLGLVITDEQHRFGVVQRSSLQDKGRFPHVLVMSATPIPRTLALILMGDLDISNVDELPPGRQKVDTLVVGEGHRERLNGFIAKQVAEGRQVYIVCPSVEVKTDEGEEASGNDIISFDFHDEDEALPTMKSAVQYEENLRLNVFPELNTAFIHGRMKGKEKDAIMERFAAGEIDVLVSTTVIEVGVNVPNATLMIVENAERFGLSQLHQLRGRVGRGQHKSYCVLVSDAEGENARSRLEIMRTTADGYKIAQKDLEIRGPGDFIASASGARQHGDGGFPLTRFAADSLLLDKVFKAAAEVIDGDLLSSADNEKLMLSVKSVNGSGALGLN